MSSNKPLVTNTQKIVKEGINDTETKRNVVRKAITHHKGKKLTQSTKHTNQKHLKVKKYKCISNESNTGMALNESRSLDKLRASQRIETEDTVKKISKSRSISSDSLSDKSTKIENPREINVRSDSPSVSSMSRHGSSITTISPDKELILFKIKRKKIS